MIWGNQKVSNERAIAAENGVDKGTILLPKQKIKPMYT
jgi:hypothetical protein